MRSNNSHAENLWFADKEYASLYDDTIELVAPQYQLAHDSMVQLLIWSLRGEIEFPARNGPNDCPMWAPDETVEGWMLDLGSGTGTETLSILQKFPKLRVVAVDVMQPMHERFKHGFENDTRFKGQGFSDRVVTVEKDFVKLPKDLKSLLPKDAEKTPYKAIISAFAIHHLTPAKKRELYQKAFDALDRGGVFLNLDLYNYKSPKMTQVAQRYDLEWIYRQFNNPDPQFAQANSVSAKQRKDMSEKWIAHYVDAFVNRLGSVDGFRHPRPDRTDQVEMLSEIGFREVSVPFRFWQVGLLLGRK